jgi:hypothetical protein
LAEAGWQLPGLDVLPGYAGRQVCYFSIKGKVREKIFFFSPFLEKGEQSDSYRITAASKRLLRDIVEREKKNSSF